MLNIHKRALLALADNLNLEAKERINPTNPDDLKLFNQIARNTESIRHLIIKAK